MKKFLTIFGTFFFVFVLIVLPRISFAQYIVEEEDPNIVRTLNNFFFGNPEGTLEGQNDPWESIDPAVRTVTVTEIGRTSAVVQVYYSSNGAEYTSSNAPILFVEYGTDRDMEQRTEAVAQSKGTRTVSFKLGGLDENDTHYVRAVLLYGGKVGYGDRLSFETGVQTTNTSGGASGGTYNQGGSTGGTTTYTPPANPAPKPPVKTPPKDKDTSIIGTSIFGKGFFPATLLGWVIIIGLIIVVVFLVLGATKKK